MSASLCGAVGTQPLGAPTGPGSRWRWQRVPGPVREPQAALPRVLSPKSSQPRTVRLVREHAGPSLDLVFTRVTRAARVLALGYAQDPDLARPALPRALQLWRHTSERPHGRNLAAFEASGVLSGDVAAPGVTWRHCDVERKRRPFGLEQGEPFVADAQPLSGAQFVRARHT